MAGYLFTGSALSSRSSRACSELRFRISASTLAESRIEDVGKVRKFPDVACMAARFGHFHASSVIEFSLCIEQVVQMEWWHPNSGLLPDRKSTSSISDPQESQILL